MKIKSKIRDYSLFLEENTGFLKELLGIETAFFVIDKNVYSLYRSCFEKLNEERVYFFEAREETKTMTCALEICERMMELPEKRNATMVAIGGGITQDVSGFAANILYRGVKWIFIPTTLLSACDSCIGGKTSLNFGQYKNLLGTFYPPYEIHIYQDFFHTLSNEDYLSGLGEILKFNIMSGRDCLKSLKSDMEKIQTRDQDTIARYLKKGLEYKQTFIEADEFDRGERIKLNFAHTFGHAVETVTGYKVPHGTAVAIGMIMANYISGKRGYISDKDKKQAEELLIKIIQCDRSYLRKPTELYLNAIKKDKKQTDEAIRCVLITRYEDTESELSVRNDISKEEIAEAIEYFLQLYGV